MNDKVCVVTGATGGLGRAISLKLAELGAVVCVVDIIKGKIADFVEELTRKELKAEGFQIDITDRNQIADMVKQITDKYEKIDVLVNAAGITISGPIEELTEENWDKTININLKGTFNCCQIVGKEMIKQRSGSIINFGSVAGTMPQVGLGAYSPSKAGVILLSKLLAMEWAKYNIRVNSISPGPINTEMTQKVFNTPSARRARERSIPMNRFGEPYEIANGVLFLASEAASYITGENLAIDGGSQSSVFHQVVLLNQIANS